MAKKWLVLVGILLGWGWLWMSRCDGGRACLSVKPQVAGIIDSADSTQVPVHPLSIESLRQMDFSDVQLTIEEELAPGPNYSRFIAAYESEGLKIEGYLTIPDGDTPDSGWPVIIFNHGFIPPSQYRSTERYVAYVDGFARNGYIVFRSDYRGHGESEGKPEGAYGSNGYSVDVLNATAALKNFEAADANRVGMWGHSLGGFLTLRAMVVDPDIKAGVMWGGVVGSYEDIFEHWWTQRKPRATGDVDEDMRRSRTREQLDYIRANQELFKAVSANYFVGDISGPVQLHHGEADETVPDQLSRELESDMMAAGKQVELFTYPGTDHNLSQSFGMAMERSVEFFDEHVKGDL